METMEVEENEAIEPAWRSLSILPCTEEFEKTDPEKASLLYERHIYENAGSYKLWHAYLLHKVRQLEGKSISDKLYDDVNSCFERALVFMHKMPRIWMEYCSLLDKQMFITRTRRTYDRALEALPITQHAKIWPLYLDFIKRDHIPVETAVRVFKRYIQMHPERSEIFIDYLYIKNRIDEAATLLCDIINRPHFQSKRDKTKYQLWEELCDMICDFSDQIKTIDAIAVLRDGIVRYTDQQGRLWNALARYHVNLGMFASARNVYDEAINSVTTKKDFVEVWEAYTNFEEKYLEHLMELDDLTEDQILELDIRQAALEQLITNNGLMMNRVALRQNPHNIKEWQKRVQLYKQLEISDDGRDQVEETYLEALQVVDPKQALGNYEDLWIEFASYLISCDRIEDARDAFESAVKAKYVKLEGLATVWCAYIEFEMSIDLTSALKLARRATANVKNLKLWSLCANLEENVGTFNSTKATYDTILDLKIATPQLILNYAAYLEEKHYFEEAFRVYERGTSLFKWPNSYCIWLTYLDKFFQRYAGKKLDRTRDLLEKCLKDCPSEYCFEIYVLYAKLEEEHGLLSRVDAVYKRAATKVANKDKANLFKVYIRSMMKLVDLNKVRSIYNLAIESLDNKSARAFCLEYAALEQELGEIDRARGIFSFCSQMCDPRVDKEFWKLWAEFEQTHGCLESIDEMLRIKRSTEILHSGPQV